MTLFSGMRVVIAIVGAVLFLGGVALLILGGDAAAAGISPLLIGGVALIAVVLERQRYRSAAADPSHSPAGPGGGEPNGVPAGFRPTEERFVDPTSGRVMRVFVDERSGERRYRAEA